MAGTSSPSLELLTNSINLDEPCYMLAEVHKQSPDYRGFHRYQIIVVVRNDRLYEMRRDLGLAIKFYGVDQFRIPGGVRDSVSGRFYIEHTVGELLEIADKMREMPNMSRSLPKTDLIGLYLKSLEQARDSKHMVFGPYQTRGVTRTAKNESKEN